MAPAKAKGIKIGRPKLEIEIRQRIAQRAKKGETPYAIAKALGIYRTLRRNTDVLLNAPSRPVWFRWLI